MASSTQYSIRSVMIVTAAAAVVSAILGPPVRQMEPEHQLRLGLFFAAVAVVTGLFAVLRLLQRCGVERKAGPLLWQTDAGEKNTRWFILILAVVLATAAAKGMIVIFNAGESVWSFGGLMLSSCILAASLLAAEFYLYRWWQTGPLITEVRKNGLVLRGVVFLKWSVLRSYQPSGEGPAVLLVNESTGSRIQPRQIHMACTDRTKMERTLQENGVLPASPSARTRGTSSAEQSR